jgi:hypothetical protein
MNHSNRSGIDWQQMNKGSNLTEGPKKRTVLSVLLKFLTFFMQHPLKGANKSLRGKRRY